MTVYIVKHNIRYEGSEIAGVYATREAAEAYCHAQVLEATLEWKRTKDKYGRVTAGERPGYVGDGVWSLDARYAYLTIAELPVQV